MPSAARQKVEKPHASHIRLIYPYQSDHPLLPGRSGRGRRGEEEEEEEERGEEGGFDRSGRLRRA